MKNKFIITLILILFYSFLFAQPEIHRGSQWIRDGDNIYPISTTDNVGIGTITPSQKLEVIGTVLANGFTLGNDELITFGTRTFKFDGTTDNDFELSDDLTIEDATPHLRLTDTTAAEDDFEIYADANQLYLTNVTDSKEYLRINENNLIQLYNQIGFVFPDGAPSDNQILKYDLALGRLAWEVDATGNVIAQFTITNGNTAIDATVTDPVACVRIPNNSIITAWYIYADQSGSIVLDVWKDVWANHPPTNADSIAGTEKPTLTSAVSASDTSLTSITTDWNQNDICCIEIESASTVTKVWVDFIGYND